MKKNPYPDFEDVVLETIDQMEYHGYLPRIEYGEGTTYVEYVKTINVDPVTVECRISFQLLPFPEPQLGFKVNLGRVPSPLNVISDYKSIALPMRALLTGYFNVNPFPPGVYVWEFADRGSLAQQLKKTQSFIIKYAIDWLEDPKSNIQWVKAI